MSNRSRLTQKLLPHFPQRITPHLVKLSRRRRKLPPKTARVLAFVQNGAATTCPDPETFTALCDILWEPKKFLWRERIVAAWALGKADLSEEQKKRATEALAHQLNYGGKTRGQWRRTNTEVSLTCAGGWAVSIMGCAALLKLLIGGKEAILTPDQSSLLLFLGFICGIALLFTPVILFTTLAYRACTVDGVRLEAARSLGLNGQAEAVSALLWASQNMGFFTNAGREALTRTLPALTYGEHYGTVERETVPHLFRLLRRSFVFQLTEVTEWQMVLLGALEQVGDTRAIEPLKRLIRHETKALRDSSRVTERAAQVITTLEERVARETEQTTLLRGADAPIDPQTLLRSYNKPIETPAEQLLRAGQKKDEAND